MPQPYSHDLRSRALGACDEEERREEGRDRPKAMGGGPLPVIGDAVESVLDRLGAARPLRAVVSDNHLTLAQYRDKLADETGISVHPGGPGAAALGAFMRPRWAAADA